MITINPQHIHVRDTYKLLIGTVAPRPIAFVTTVAQDGTVNGAPFSFFNIVSSAPPLLSVSVQRRHGVQKDTARNVLEQKSFVIHITDEENVEAVNETAATLAPTESEIKRTNFTLTKSSKVNIPAIAEAKVRFECTLEKHVPLGDEETITTDLLIGRIVAIHIAEDVYDDGKIIYEKLQPVGRLAGNDYANLGQIFSLIRPK